MNLLFVLILINLQWLEIVRQYLKLQRGRKCRVRRWWVKPFLRENERNRFGAYEKAFCYYQENDHEEFEEMMRMTPSDFEELYRIVGPYLQKVSRRQPLSPRLRLALAINFLAHADSISTTRKFFRVGRSTTFSIIQEVCSVIWNTLSPTLLRRRTAAENKVIAGGYRVRWHLPNCVGCMDGKEIRIHAPSGSGSLFFNYKRFFSFKLLATCDAYYRFTWINIGDYGSNSDLSSFRNTGLYDSLERSEANLPPNCNLPRTNIPMPFYYVGDEIFMQKAYMMVPYPRRLCLNETQTNYNRRLSRARNCIEDSFGILCSVWQILNVKLRYKLETSISITKAVVCLHNFRATRKLERGENLEDDIPQEILDARRPNLEDHGDDDDDDDDDLDVPNIDYLPEEIPMNGIEYRNVLANYLLSDEAPIP